jgi:hypothetical protein
MDLERGYFYLNEPDDMTAEEWCAGRIGPKGSCFEGSRPTEHQNAENEERCVCEDHDCHEEALEKLEAAKEQAEKEGRGLYDWENALES